MSPPRVDSSRTNTTQLHDNEPICTTPPKPTTRPTHEVTQATGGDHLGEATIREQLSDLDEHESYELSLKAAGGVEGFAAKAEGKLKVSRRHDGQFEVEVSNTLGGGAGADAHHKATLNLGGGARYVAPTAAAAADLVQALMVGEALGAAALSGPGSAQLAAMVDLTTGVGREAAGRVLAHTNELAEVRAALGGSADATAHGLPANGGLKTEGKFEASAGAQGKYDFETGIFTISVGGEVKLEGEGSLNLETKGFGALGATIQQFESRFGGKVEGKLCPRFEQRIAIPLEMRQKLASGALDVADLAIAAAKLPWERVLVVDIELEARGNAGGTGALKGKLTAELPLARGQNPLDQLMNTKWQLEGEKGHGLEMKLSAQVVGGEASAMKWTKGETKQVSLREGLEDFARDIESESQLMCSLEQRRSVANLSQ